MNARDVLNSTLLYLSVAAFDKVRPLIPSRILQAALYLTRAQVKLRPDNVSAFAAPARGIGTMSAALSIPHYWALYVHDGRGPFGPRRAQYLVWFTDPADDPRLVNGPPVRASDIKRLTKDDFQRGLKINAQRRALGLPLYMQIAKLRRGDPPHPFFEKGLRDFAESTNVGQVTSDNLTAYIKERVKSRPLNVAKGRI